MTSNYRAQTTSILLDEMRSYRNSGPGILIVNSENVILDGSQFSDNRGNIDVHRSESVQIKNTSIVGKSEEVELLEATQSGLSTLLCPNRQTVISAVHIHSFTRARQGSGVSVEDVDISGFVDINNCKEYAFQVDPEVSLCDPRSIFSHGY
jgi:hypothetical protein